MSLKSKDKTYRVLCFLPVIMLAVHLMAADHVMASDISLKQDESASSSVADPKEKKGKDKEKAKPKSAEGSTKEGPQEDGEAKKRKASNGKKRRVLEESEPSPASDEESDSLIIRTKNEKKEAPEGEGEVVRKRALLNPEDYDEFDPNEDLPGCEDNYNRCMGAFWRMSRHGFRFIGKVTGILGNGLAIYTATGNPSDATKAWIGPITIVMGVVHAVTLPLESMAIESSLEHERDLKEASERFHRGQAARLKLMNAKQVAAGKMILASQQDQGEDAEGDDDLEAALPPKRPSKQDEDENR